MREFDNRIGERRRLNISNMERNEVKDYFLQFFSMDSAKKEKEEQRLKEEIKDREESLVRYKWILAIKSKEGKVVGKIEVFELIKDQRAFLTIEIPNENWIYRYGTEAIHEFIKICKEQLYFSELELEAKNKIVDSYLHSVPEEKKQGYLVKIA